MNCQQTYLQYPTKQLCSREQVGSFSEGNEYNWEPKRNIYSNIKASSIGFRLSNQWTGWPLVVSFMAWHLSHFFDIMEQVLRLGNLCCYSNCHQFHRQLREWSYPKIIQIEFVHHCVQPFHHVHKWSQGNATVHIHFGQATEHEICKLHVSIYHCFGKRH